MTNRKHIAITLLASALLVVGLIMVLEKRNDSGPELLLNQEGEVAEINGPLTAAEQNVMNYEQSNAMNPTAVITTNAGVIEIELFEDQMPVTVGNFISLAESGFYNGTKFHRVIEGFMIQGGDPNTKGDNESTYGTGGSNPIPDEFVSGELLTNTRGTIAMANAGPNTGSSQFFINIADNTFLDGRHPVFGRVTKGIETVDTIEKVQKKPNNSNELALPVDPIVVQSVQIVR